MSAENGDLSLDAVFQLLADQRRRYALVCLEEHGSLALSDLAEEIARRENGARIPDLAEEEVLRVYMSLWHSHIPRFETHDVVEYDQEQDVVRLDENAELVTDFLPGDSGVLAELGVSA